MLSVPTGLTAKADHQKISIPIRFVLSIVKPERLFSGGVETLPERRPEVLNNAGTPLCLLVCGDSQQFSRISMHHGLSFSIRAIHRLDFLRRHPVAEIERDSRCRP